MVIVSYISIMKGSIVLATRKWKKDGARDLFQQVIKTPIIDGRLYRWFYDNFSYVHDFGLLDRDDLINESKNSKDSVHHLTQEPVESSKVVRKGKIENGDIGHYEYMDAGPRFVCTYESVSIIGPSGLGISNEGKIIAETVGTPNSMQSHVSRSIAHSIGQSGPVWTYNRLKSNSRTYFPSSDPDFEEACLLIPLFNNYYHWTIECLPKIRGIETYTEETGNTPTYLIPEDMTSWMFEALSLAGVDPDEDCVQWNERESLVSNLVIPSYPEPTPAECRWLKNRMYDSVEINSSETIPEKYIYISREDATKRRVRNEDELMSSLSEYGFERYILSELSVAEQVELFSKAEIVLSPHGAGLTNIIYAPNDVTVIELFGDRKKNTFYRIAEMLGYEYRYIDCDHDSVDIIVDVDRIEREVQDLVGGT